MNLCLLVFAHVEPNKSTSLMSHLYDGCHVCCQYLVQDDGRLWLSAYADVQVIVKILPQKSGIHFADSIRNNYSSGSVNLRLCVIHPIQIPS